MAKKSNVPDGTVPGLPLEAGTLSRRRFLQALAALGASVALPGPIGEASAEAIDAAWARFVEAPWYFEVSEWGTIVDPGIAEPKTRSDVYDIGGWRPRDPEALIAEVESVPPLVSAFQCRAEDHWLELEAELEEFSRRSPRRAELRRLIEELSDPDDGWMAWIRHEGPAGIDRFWAFVQEWLAEPVDWRECDWFPIDWGCQGQAYRFFRDMDRELLDTLGVVIVEGDCPGSSYFAAEPRSGIEYANAAAERLGLPFRFRAEEVRS